MKIAYVYDAVYPWKTGGVQKRVWELSRRLSDAHEVHWYGLQYWDGCPILEREGVTIHGVAPAPELYVGDGRRSIPEALVFAAKLTPALLRQNFDVIDCQEFPYFPCFTSKLGSVVRSTTLFMTWHEVWGDYWYEYLGRKGAVGKAVERLCVSVPDAHISVSRRTRRDVRHLGANSVLLPNGISLNEIQNAQPVDHSVDVLFVGRLIPAKNATLLVRAIERLQEENPNIRCMIVGEGPERDSILQTIERLNLRDNIDVLPFQDSYETILGLMKSADVFVLPSQREGFGITVLEALASGTSVVTIDHRQNAAQELIDDGQTGVICQPTPSSLANGISRAKQTILPADCRESALEYDWDRIAERAETIYKESY